MRRACKEVDDGAVCVDCHYPGSPRGDIYKSDVFSGYIEGQLLIGVFPTTLNSELQKTNVAVVSAA